MKFSVLFQNIADARRARRELRRARLLRWSDMTSIHERQIQVDQLPIEHTSARAGALFGALVVGFVSAIVMGSIAFYMDAQLGIGAALALGLAAGALFGGVFGAIAFATRPAAFITAKKDALEDGRALMVCDIADPTRAEKVRDRLELRAQPQAA
ncbi:MAG: hypothetical protein ACE37F_38300 [Nannocystaceae bacterium]|nr:hypothetical protein [bacterium]